MAPATIGPDGRLAMEIAAASHDVMPTLVCMIAARGYSSCSMMQAITLFTACCKFRSRMGILRC
jgi:hypothetical protein